MEKKRKKILQVLDAEKTSLPAEGKPDTWFLYLLECADGTYYTGITKDLDHRLKMHASGKASRYTRVRRPVKVLYSEMCDGRTRALVRECEVKAYPRKKKEALVQSGKSRRLAAPLLQD